MSLEQLIVQYGYLALFIGAFLEGETILVVAGFLASRGYLDLHWVIIAAFLGTFAGDQTFFHLGRTKGIEFLEKYGRWKRQIDRAFDLLHRHQVPLIIGFRFIYGIRNVTPFVIGASRLSPRRFFILNFLGALTWAIVVGVLGYQFGNALQVMLDHVKKYELLIVGIVFAIGLIMFWRSNISKK